jgi:hypothetical protein
MPVQRDTTTTVTRGVCKKIRRKGLNEQNVKNAIRSQIINSYLGKEVRVTRSNSGSLVPWIGAPHRGRGVAVFRCTDIEITLVPTSAGGNNTTSEIPCSAAGLSGGRRFNYTSFDRTVNPPQCPPTNPGPPEMFTWGTPSGEVFAYLSGTSIQVQYKVQEIYTYNRMYLGAGSYSGTYRPAIRGPFRVNGSTELGLYDKTVTGTSAKSITVSSTCPY